jgi:hypothetical protein
VQRCEAWALSTASTSFSFEVASEWCSKERRGRRGGEKGINLMKVCYMHVWEYRNETTLYN